MRRAAAGLGLLWGVQAWAQGLGLPPDASTHGHRTDALLVQAQWLGGALALVGTLWLVVACVRFGRRHTAHAEDGTSRRARAMVLGLALGTFLVVDGHLFLGSERVLAEVLHRFPDPADPRTVRIEVNAQRWAWAARYPGTDGRFNTPDDVVTWNDIRLPAGRPVYFQLAASDVVHGFNLPHLRVQAQAIPGRIQHLWTEAAVPGTWEVNCSQHCGAGHYRMRGTLTVLPEAAFEAWAREESARAARTHDAADPGLAWGWEWKAR